ncbi:MAG TPA: hypothetical protein VHF89_02040 [Solirubrobacteraceae bacterium]|nr:hypothetical protein [Solirubrobacteraceae bacterium]
MRFDTRARVLAAAVAVAVILLAAAPAHAAPPTTSCSFTGLAGEIHPGVRAILNGPGGAGAYEFAGQAVDCVHTDRDGNRLHSGARITSIGVYANLICGTGSVQSSTDPLDTQVLFEHPGIPDITQLDYQIQFVNGTGALQVVEANGAPVSGGGPVVITPYEGDCIDENVTAFDVAGSFTIVR